MSLICTEVNVGTRFEKLSTGLALHSYTAGEFREILKQTIKLHHYSITTDLIFYIQHILVPTLPTMQLRH